MSYWDEIDRLVTEAEQQDQSEDRPDPWADRMADAPTLTGAQVAFLAALADQPGAPRVADDRDPNRPPAPTGRDVPDTPAEPPRFDGDAG